jgi:hypothetical protein
LSAIWMPGAVGPMDELVARIRGIVAAFAQEQGLEQAEVRVELLDGRELLVSSILPDPGFGFLTFELHARAEEEPRRVIVGIGAVKLIDVSRPDTDRPVGFSLG